MTISYEIDREHRPDWPPFADGCPRCVDWHGVVVPHATATQGDTLVALYRHGRCGHEWATSWPAQYAPTWQRVIGPGQNAIAA